jgi:hypothetical protein
MLALNGLQVGNFDLTVTVLSQQDPSDFHPPRTRKYASTTARRICSSISRE